MSATDVGILALLLAWLIQLVMQCRAFIPEHKYQDSSSALSPGRDAIAKNLVCAASATTDLHCCFHRIRAKKTQIPTWHGMLSILLAMKMAWSSLMAEHTQGALQQSLMVTMIQAQAMMRLWKPTRSAWRGN